MDSDVLWRHAHDGHEAPWDQKAARQGPGYAQFLVVRLCLPSGRARDAAHGGQVDGKGCGQRRPGAGVQRVRAPAGRRLGGGTLRLPGSTPKARMRILDPAARRSDQGRALTQACGFNARDWALRAAGWHLDAQGGQRDSCERIAATKRARTMRQGNTGTLNAPRYLHQALLPLSLNKEKALCWLRKATDHGSVDAVYNLAGTYVEGLSVEPDPKKGFGLCKAVAEEGAPVAEAALGEMRDTGTGVPRAAESVCMWLRKGAEHGDAKALARRPWYDIARKAPRESRRRAVQGGRMSKRKGSKRGAVRKRKNSDRLDIRAVILEAEAWSQEVRPDWPTPTASLVNEYRRRAADGDMEASRLLAALILSGRAPSKVPNEAVRNLRQSAESGDAWAEMYLGTLLIDGRQVRRDPAEGLEFIRKSAEQGLGYAQHLLGTELLRGGEDGREEALKWFRRATEQGVQGAMSAPDTAGDASADQGAVTPPGKPGPDRAGEALDEMTRDAGPDLARLVDKARGGDAPSQLALARVYETGGTPATWRRSIYWHELAASQGCTESMCQLAQQYSLGAWVPQDERRSHSWIARGMELGDPNCTFLLATRLLEGRGIAKDEKRAFELCLQAAQKGVPDAEALLGRMYASGSGTQKNMAEAFKWYRRGGAHGVPEAMLSLWYMYHNGVGVLEDSVEAERWRSKLIEAAGSSRHLLLRCMAMLKHETDRHEVSEDIFQLVRTLRNVRPDPDFVE